MATLSNEMTRVMNNNQVQKEISCIQINLQHSRIATDSLMWQIAKDGVNIAIIQEPYTINNKVAGISKRFRIFQCGEGRPRAATVVINNKIDVLLIKQLSDEDTVVLEMSIERIKYYIISIYLDIEKQLEEDLEKLNKILKFTERESVLIAMDSNSRSTMWYDRLTNPRGRVLEEYLCSKGLFILNEEKEMTTFQNRIGSSNIDLTITNNRMIAGVKGWDILKEESSSDHNFIRFFICQEIAYKNSINYNGIRYIVKEGNFKKFDKKIAQHVAREFKFNVNEEAEKLDDIISAEIEGENDIEMSIEKFQTALSSTCNDSFTKKWASKRITRNKIAPWWTQELTIRRKKVNALRRRYQRTKNNEILRDSRKTQYYEERTQYQGLIKKEKKESWKKFCNVTTSQNPWNIVYKLASGKIKNNTIMTTLRKEDGTNTTNAAETTQYILEKLVPVDNTEKETNYHILVRTDIKEPVQNEDDRDFTQEEIKNIISSMDPKKAPGEDGITSKILYRAFINFPKIITTLYNGCLRTGTFPKIWKKAILIPIVKPGKENSDEVSKFRLISLLKTGGKVLEKALINRIMHHINRNMPLNENQYGFMPQKSTTDAVMALKEFVEENLETGKILVLVSLDVKGAFDAAWWPNIIQSLKNFKCPENLYNTAKSYFNQRTVVMTLNSITLEREATRGCPQGSCCGPGFWNIQYNSLLNLNFTRHTKAIAYADDLMLAITGKTIREAENITNIELRKIMSWTDDNKVEFNEGKSKVMLISRRKRREDKAIKIYMKNKLLQQVNNMKYLGIILDSKFKFRDHIKYAADRCSTIIHILSKSAKLHWGLNHEALKTIYKGAILPLLLYGAPVWINAMRYESNRKLYIRVQRLINIKMAKAYRTTSAEALCTLTGMMPIIIKAEESAKLYNITRGSRKLKEFDHEAEPKSWPHPADSIRIYEEEGKVERNISTLQIFTDGSKGAYGVGAGIVTYMDNVLKCEERFKLDNRCSNNQAEQLAIVKALDTIERNTREIAEQNRIAIIYTDSKITIDSLKNTKKHTNLINEIRNKVKTLEIDKWRVSFAWIKAHAGIHGNELADRTAKAAASDQNATVYYKKIPKTAILKELNEDGLQKWQQEWNITTKGAITKSFFPNILSRHKIKFNFTSNFTAMVTGHGKTRSYFHRFKIMDNPGCPCNNDIQSVEHLLFDCPILKDKRELLKNEIIKTRTWPPTKEELVTKYLKYFKNFTDSIDFENL